MRIYDYNQLKYSFYSTAIRDILAAFKGGATVGSFILSFCCIDYMGMALDPKKDKNTSSDFKQYIKDFMTRVNGDYESKEDILWNIRNSLIHVYGRSKSIKVSGIGFDLSYEHPEYHLRLIDKSLWINLPEFISELIASIELFFRENRNYSRKMNLWYSKLIIRTGASGYYEMLETHYAKKPLLGRIHKCFEILDKDPEIDIINLRNHFLRAINSWLDDRYNP